MLNFGIMKNPLNWIIVTLMVLIAAVVFHMGARLLSNSEGT